MWRTKIFKTKAAYDAWVLTQGFKYEWHNIFINNGYGVEYRCCAERDKQRMRDTGKITLYLTVIEPDPNALGTRLLPPWYACKITNWHSSLVLQGGCHKGRHNIAGTRYDVWFNFEGYEWWGVSYGEDTRLVYCKRTKKKV